MCSRILKKDDGLVLRISTFTMVQRVSAPQQRLFTTAFTAYKKLQFEVWSLALALVSKQQQRTGAAKVNAVYAWRCFVRKRKNVNYCLFDVLVDMK